MKNFFRALRGALKFWPSLLIATICSFAVAGLWGANIGAFYPILEVTIDGKSMHTWIDEEIERYEQSVNASQILWTDHLARSVNVDQVDPELAERSQQSARAAKEELVDALRKREWYRTMSWWIKNFVPNDPFETIALLVGLLILSTLVKHVFLIGGEVLVGRVALNVSRTLRMNVYDKALFMDRKGYSEHGTGTFTANIAHTSDMLSNGMISMLGGAMREPLKMISCLVGAGIICWRLLLMSIIVAPVVGLLLYYVTKRLRSVAKTQLEKASNYHSVMLEGLGNINTIQAFGMEQRESQRFGDATEAVRDFGLKFVFYTSLSKPIIEFLGLGMLGTTIIGGAYLVLNQETSILGIPISEEQLTVSALLVFFGMLIGVSDPLRKLSAVYSSIYAGSMAADAIFGILDRKNLIESPRESKSVEVPHRELAFHDLHFGYKEDTPILQDVSLSVPFGSTIAIVGHNGSGKSTLIHLLNRFYDPNRGSLTLDGVDFRDMRIDDIRGRIGLVTQHTDLFDESVSYNIRYGRPDASDKEVIAAAKAAQAHDFISTVLSEGYETRVGQNGNRLSGGQRQRIALARALLCDPEILILDEATSQIDMASEQAIREALTEHRGDRTMIIITHREKLLELADRVFEVQDGRLIEAPHLTRRAA
ncbi:MAG: ABC transporter ATP-binding protein [Planctomycetota bacterium]|nr:ABC transporter ATP-binding protein [Planctomycetota bacterium]